MITMTKEGKKRIGRGGIEMEDLGDVELPPELDADIQARTKRADDELAATTVNFRWQKGQLDLVKKVAGAMGVPYQTYIKMVVYKQVLTDLAFMIGSTGQSFGSSAQSIVRSAQCEGITADAWTATQSTSFGMPVPPAPTSSHATKKRKA